MSEDNKQFKPVDRYIVSLQTNGYTTKVSQMDLSRPMDMMKVASQGIEQKELLNKADSAYKTLLPKLSGQIKTHLNHISQDYINKKPNELGNLKFKKPTLYLKVNESTNNDDFNEENVGTKEESTVQMITPSDEALAYSFLMFRLLMGKNASPLEPHYIVSFSKSSGKTYDNNDVLNTFLYIDNKNQELRSHSNVNGKNKPNQDAIKLLQEDKKEVEAIVKNVFGTYNFECNEMRQAEEQYKIAVCKSYTDYSSPDFFIDMLTCLEVFKLAGQASYCPEIAYHEDFDL